MIRIIVILLGVIGLFTGAGAGEEGTRERIEADIRFLADDLLWGAEPAILESVNYNRVAISAIRAENNYSGHGIETFI